MPQTRTKPPGIAIGLQPGTRILRIDWMSDLKAWDIWLNATGNWETGTFLRLYDNGKCERHYFDGEAVYEVTVVKPEDDRT